MRYRQHLATARATIDSTMYLHYAIIQIMQQLCDAENQDMSCRSRIRAMQAFAAAIFCASAVAAALLIHKSMTIPSHCPAPCITPVHQCCYELRAGSVS